MQLSMVEMMPAPQGRGEQEVIDCLRLFRSRRVGPATYHRLIRDHGSAGAALDALPDIAAAAGVKGYQVCPEPVALAELCDGRIAGAELILAGDPGYPAFLAEISDAPPLLWAIGNTELLTRPSVAMVGARNASSLGLRIATSLAGDLGQAGKVIVSGMARGIDAACHAAALDTGTIAVMPGGVDVVYPRESIELAHSIAENGIRLSEHPLGTIPQTRHFPQRNRIISGLAEAVVVVEAAAKSGSMITARAAAEQGREVLAVPAHPFDARASGCNILIRDGATLVRNCEDVLLALRADAAALAPATPAAPAPPDEPSSPLGNGSQETARPASDLMQLQRDIVAILGDGPLSEDGMIRVLSRPASQIGAAVLMLETQGEVARLAGGVFARN